MQIIGKFRFAIFAFLMLISTMAFGQFEEEGREFILFQDVPIVSSQSFFKRKTTQAPGYATVIKNQKYSTSPVRTMAEILEIFSPGFNLFINGGSGPTIGVRGVTVDSNAKTLFMLDGQHLNHRQHFGYSNELASPLIGDIDYLEVVNGPGAIVHGSGAISGFVNLIPKKGSEYKGLILSSEFGPEEESLKFESTYGMSYGFDNDLLIYVGFITADGTSYDKERWDTRMIYLGEYPDTALRNYLADTQVYANDDSHKIALYWNHGDFNLNLFYRQDDHSANSLIYATRDYQITPFHHTASLGVRPKYLWNLTDTESVEFKGSLMWLENGTYDYEEDSEGSSEHHKEIKAIVKSTRFAYQSLAGGILFGQKRFKANHFYFGKSPVINWEGNTGDWDEFSLFAENVIDLNEKLVLSLGARYDNVTYGPVKTSNNAKLPETDNTSLRLASAYEIDGETSVKLSYQEGFRYLDMAYMYWWSYWNERIYEKGFRKGFPDFKPETMKSTELNFSKRFMDKRLKLDLNLFYNEYEDMLTFQKLSVTNPHAVDPLAVTAILQESNWLGSHVNALGDFSSYGGELIADWIPFDGFHINLSYSYTVPTNVSKGSAESIDLFTDDKKEWLLHPTHLVKTTLNYSPINDLSLEFTNIYSSSITDDETRQLVAPVYENNRSITDFAVSYQLNSNFIVKLMVRNLFEIEEPRLNLKYRPHMGNGGEAERFYYISASYRFS